MPVLICLAVPKDSAFPRAPVNTPSPQTSSQGPQEERQTMCKDTPPAPYGYLFHTHSTGGHSATEILGAATGPAHPTGTSLSPLLVILTVSRLAGGLALVRSPQGLRCHSPALHPG